MKLKFIKGDFFTVPNRTILRKLPSRAQVVFICICSHMDDKGRCFPATTTISRETGVSRSTIFLALKDLEAVGMIEKTSRVRGRSNEYQVMIVASSQPVQNPDGSVNPVQLSDIRRPAIVHQTSSYRTSDVQPLDGNYTQVTTQREGTNTNDTDQEKIRKQLEREVNDVLNLGFFHRVFPSDFVETSTSPRAYDNVGIRNLIKANLLIYPLVEIVRVLDAYEERSTEPYAPSPGKSVYGFFADNKLGAIRRFVDKKAAPRSSLDKMLHPYEKKQPTKADDDFGKMVRANMKRKEQGLPPYKYPSEMYDDESKK